MSKFSPSRWTLKNLILRLLDCFISIRKMQQIRSGLFGTWGSGPQAATHPRLPPSTHLQDRASCNVLTPSKSMPLDCFPTKTGSVVKWPAGVFRHREGHYVACHPGGISLPPPHNGKSTTAADDGPSCLALMVWLKYLPYNLWSRLGTIFWKVFF